MIISENIDIDIDIDIDKANLKNIDIDIDIDKEILVNIDIDIDIDKEVLENIDIDIDIDKEILENIDIDIDIDKEISENIDIDKISNRLEFGISNRARVGRPLPHTLPYYTYMYYTHRNLWTQDSGWCTPIFVILVFSSRISVFPFRKQAAD